MKPIGYLLIALLFSTVCSLESQAADIVATGCDSASIQAKLNIAGSGDTVWFPSGSCSATWSSTVNMSKSGVTLSGRTTGCPSACVDITNITGALSVQASNVRITGLTISGGGDVLTVHISGGGLSDWRIDHNHFKDGTGRDIVAGGYGGTGESVRKDFPGVIDHNSFTSSASHKNIETYGGSGSYSDWNDTVTLGGASFLFVEDNIFQSDTITDGVASIDTDSGGRIVIRHNTFTNAWITAHGVNDGDTSGNPTIHTGVHAFEIYNNIFNGNSTYWIRSNYRGGTGVIHDNTLNFGAKSNVTTPFLFQYYRGDVSSYCSGANSCTGSNSYDRNQSGLNGYLCYQQPGSTGSGHPSVSSPIYEWSNTWQGVACGTAGYTCFAAVNDCGYGHVQIGRDIILNGTTPKPGYTAYTYPHPLTTGSSTATAKPKAPYLHP